MSAEVAPCLSAEAEKKFAQEYARKKEEHGHEVAERGKTVSARKSDGEQNEVSRLRVGEYAAARHIGICVEESARQTEQDPDFQPLIDGKRRKFFPEVPHGQYFIACAAVCQVYHKESFLRLILCLILYLILYSIFCA